jgi:uncharacterized membrane protein YczE
MHLRAPAISPGVTAFLWGLFFGLFVWLRAALAGYSSSISFIVGCVIGFLSFLLVRIYGDN